MGAKKKVYYKDLDIVRVLSCILVLLYHLNILKGGYLAVCIFFVLSGYLSIISAFRKEKFSILKYYKDRLLHIYVPLLIVVFISVGVVSLIPSINWLSLKPETTSVILGYNNYWQLSANMDYFAHHIGSPFMHFWYIGILLQFELVFPLIFYLLKFLGNKIKKCIPVILMTVLSFAGFGYFFYASLTKNIMVTYYDTFIRLFSILFGLTIGLYHVFYSEIKSCYTKNKLTGRIIFYAYLLVTILLCILIPSTSSYYSITMLLITLIGCRLIDYGTLYPKEELNFFDKTIKSFAKVTYEVYLIQYPVIFLLQDIEMNNILRIIIIILITIILSYILHFALDYKKNSEGKIKLLVLRIITLVLVSAGAIFGIYKYVIAKDHTEEMKELEEQLNRNEEMMQKKQEEYAANLKEEEDKWNDVLADLESGEEKIADLVKNMPIVAIGDSVMLGGMESIYKEFPKAYVDAKVSRADCEVPNILRNLKNKGRLGDVVVLGLGTNGSCGEGTRKEIMKILSDKKVFWLTVTNDREVHINSKIINVTKNYDNAYLIDWNEISKGHRNYFVADGIHLTGTGRQVYSKTIYEAIYNLYLDEYTKKKNSIIEEHQNELKEKITFFGNDVIINIFDMIKEKFQKTDFRLDKSYNYDKLYEEIKKDVESGTLNHRVVLAFDKQAGLTSTNYVSLLGLLKDYEVYVLSLDIPLSFANDNVTVIDFNSEIASNEDYLMADRIHLSKQANDLLSLLLDQIINKKSQ